MRPLGGVKVCMVAYGEKGLSLFLRPEKLRDFIWIYQHTCIAAAHNICKFKENRTWGKKLRGFEFFFAWGLMGKKGLSLFLRLEKTQGMPEIYQHTCIAAAHNICEFKKNRI